MDFKLVGMILLQFEEFIFKEDVVNGSVGINQVDLCLILLGGESCLDNLVTWSYTGSTCNHADIINLKALNEAGNAEVTILVS